MQPPPEPRGWPESASAPEDGGLHVVVLDRYAGSWFIVDSSNTVIVSVMVEEKGKQAAERQGEPRLWRPWRPPRRRMGWRVLWAVGMMVAVLTTALLIFALRPEIWKDLLEKRVLTLVALGLSLTAIVVLLAIAGARRSWTGFQGKTVWDFLQLLIVPLALAVIGLWFAAQQDARQQQIENQRAEAERDLAEQRAQDEALQAYLSQMSQLLLEKDLRNAEQGSMVRTLARSRTVTAVQRLDAEHNRNLILFLSEAGLTGVGKSSLTLLAEIELGGVDLRGVELAEADLRQADLNKVNLSRAYLDGANLDGADLSDANLSGAHMDFVNLRDYAFLVRVNLSGAKLWYVDLSNAYLNKANLSGADLSHADLSGTKLVGANLSGADLSDTNLSCSRWESRRISPVITRPAGERCSDLSGADLSDTFLNKANLNDANLSDTNLEGADVSEEQLEQAESLKDTIMPNGQKYEDWLKDKKAQGKDERNK